MSRWSNLSVRSKLTLMTMAACGAALMLVSGGVVLNEIASSRAQLTARLESVAGVVSATSTAAVQSGDARAAADALATLHVQGSLKRYIGRVRLM